MDENSIFWKMKAEGNPNPESLKTGDGGKGDPTNKNLPIYKQIAQERSITQPKRPQRIQIQLPNKQNIKYPKQGKGSRKTKKRSTFKLKQPYSSLTRNYSDKRKHNMSLGDMELFLDKLQQNKLASIGNNIMKGGSYDKKDIFAQLHRSHNQVQRGNSMSKKETHMYSYDYDLQRNNKNKSPFSTKVFTPQQNIKKTPQFIVNLPQKTQSVKGYSKKNALSEENRSLQAEKGYQGNFPHKMGQSQDQYLYQIYPQEKKFKRQYYSTISDQRDLIKLEESKAKKQQLNSFIAYTNTGLKLSAYNILNDGKSQKRGLGKQQKKKGPTYYKY